MNAQMHNMHNMQCSLSNVGIILTAITVHPPHEKINTRLIFATVFVVGFNPVWSTVYLDHDQNVDGA